MDRILKTTVLLCVSFSTAATELYKWTDENGIIHFSDRAPNVEIAPLDRNTLPSINILPLEIPATLSSASATPYGGKENYMPKYGEYRSSGHSIKGQLLFDGKPIDIPQTVPVRFWMRDNAAGRQANIQVKFNHDDSSYLAENIPPGSYGMSIDVDKNNGNNPSYPGDLRAWANFEIKRGFSIKRDINLDQIIHLTAPQDNNEIILGWSKPCDEKLTFRSPLTIRWKSLGRNVLYRYQIRNNPCEPFEFGESIAQGSTTKTFVTLSLPNTGGNHQYMLELSAHRDNRTIGSLVVHGKNGLGWDYRFLIK